MSPPSVIEFIVRPCMFIIKFEERVIRAFSADIRPDFIALLSFIYALAIKPFVKRTAMVEYAVQNDLHSSGMNLLAELFKQFIGSFQILRCRRSDYIACGVAVISILPHKRVAAVLHDPAEMRIYMIVVLTIILMIGRRHKNRV